MFFNVTSLILDMDMTLIIPINPDFYQQYGTMVESAIASHYEVDTEKALEIANYYRKHYGGAEQALYQANVHNHFTDIRQKARDYALIYDRLNTIDTQGQFQNRAAVSALLKELRKKGVTIILLTSSPDNLAKRALSDSGFDLHEDFDHAYFYRQETGPLKIISERIFDEIIHAHSLDPATCLSIGDSKTYDVLPALRAGARACLVSQDETTEDQGYFIAKDVADVLEMILNKLEIKKGGLR